MKFSERDCTNLPILVFTGLGGTCPNLSKSVSIKYLKEKLAEHGSTSKLYCVHFNTSVHGSMESVVKEACDNVTTLSKEVDLKKGFHLIGLSQGGLFARAIVEDCDIGIYARKLVTIGTPNNGTAAFPKILPEFLRGIMDKLTHKNVYSELVQNNIVQAGYFKSPDQLE